MDCCEFCLRNRPNHLTVFSANGKFRAMDAEPTVEQFIYECFRARTATLKMVLEIRRDYRQRFYHGECRWDSRRGTVEKSESEKIVSVSPSDIGAAVVTTGDDGVFRSRYDVRVSGKSWVIREIDVEYPGKGWQSWKERAKLIQPKHGELQVPRTTISNSDEESNVPFPGDPAIQQFMTDHFRERTALRKKEVEIYAEYAKRFYSPECEWTRWVGPVEGSEVEKVVRVVPFDAETQVTTLGFGFNGHGLRYHLRPAAQSWLIWDVDVECPLCRDQGKSTNCFLCGGTGWHIHKDNRGHRGGPPDEKTPPGKPRWQP